MVHLSKEQKEQAAIELCTRDGSAQEIADKYNVSRYSVYNWAWDLLGKGNVSPMPKRTRSITTANYEDVEALKQEIEQLHNEADELQRQVYRLQLEKDVLEKAAEVIKKDEGVSLEKLTNHEKAIVIDALRGKYKLHELLKVFHMAKSSYCYQQAVMKAPDKYNEVRKKVKVVFDDSSSRYGYRRIYSSLKNEAIKVSEKVIRRIMQEDKLIVPSCEGFFGRLKNEMFYGRSWQDVTIDEFIVVLDDYIHWYAEKRIKLSLGDLSPLQYRMKLGLIAA